MGPCLLVPEQPLDPATKITMQIFRGDTCHYEDSVSIERMKRSFTELVSYLFKENTFPQGVFLMTGTCLVPPDSFTLQVNDDQVMITIDGIGTLRNTVGQL